jgi:hypothetical protein
MYRYKVAAHCWLRSTLSLLFILAFCISCSNGNSANDPARGPDKPQIPTYDFEWHGVFKGSKVFEGDAKDFSAPQVVEDLVVRGKQQGEYFNVYMEQGSDERDTWVENLIYNGKFYSITHKWHTYAADGVGPDPHNGEWFLFDEWSSSPDDIILPRQCHEGHPNKRYVQQSACKNVIPPESKT